MANRTSRSPHEPVTSPQTRRCHYQIRIHGPAGGVTLADAMFVGVFGASRWIFCLTAALASVVGCSSNLPSTGTGPHSCADCAQTAACCQAVLAAMGNTTSQCSTSETVCASLTDIDEQREYIATCDGILMGQASVDGAPAPCK